MRKKKEKKGFTLIELLAVITILGIIVLIVTSSVDNVIKNSKIKVYEKQKEALLSSLQDWLTDNKDLFYDNNTMTLTLGDLKEQNYVDYDIKNPKTDKCISNDLAFTINKSGKEYTFSIENDELIDGTDDECDVLKRFPSIYLVGKSIVNLEINTNYVEEGYSAKDLDDNNITSNVEITNNIDNAKLGSYRVTYEVTIGGLTRTKIRTVNVVDTTKPVIELPANTISNTEIDTFNFMTGVTITDNSGETIIPKIKSNLSIGVSGIYEVLYIAADSSGNTSSNKRTIIIDTINPTVIVTNIDETNITFNMKDNIGIVEYGINQSSAIEPTYTTVATTKSLTTTYKVNQTGTYYIWVKDVAGRIGKVSFTIYGAQDVSYTNSSHPEFTTVQDALDYLYGVLK